MKTVLMLSGVGGTGKSSVLEELKKFASAGEYAMDNTTAFISSPTRQFYALENIENEKHLYEKSEEFRIDFQKRLFHYAVDYYASSILNNTSSIIVCDRCPIDSLAYTLVNGVLSLDKVEYDELMNKLYGFFDNLKEHNLFLAELAFPVPWGVEDNFRDIGYTKNLVTSLVMSDVIVSVLKKEYSNLKYNLYKPKQKQSVKERSVEIITWK